MDVEEFQPNRWFRLSLDDGESLKDSVRTFAERENIELGWLFALGEISEGRVASGYESPDFADKIMVDLDDNQHVLGSGTVETRNGELEVHLHGPMGRDGETATGCWAGEQSVFRGLDLLLVELDELQN